MKVSIITATHNSARTVADACTSVKGQTYPDVEYVVVDGMSSDRTLEVLRTSFGAIHKIVSEPDGGIYEALNKGIAMATGDIIGFVHSDDMLASPTILADVVSLFEKGDVHGVYGDLEYVSADDFSNVKRRWKSQPFEAGFLQKGWMPAHPTLYLRREIFEKYQGFDTTFRIAADYEFILRVMSDPGLTYSYLPKVIVKMRVGGVSNKNIANMLLKSKEDYRALKKHNIGGVGALIRKNISKLPQFYSSAPVNS